MQTTDNVTTRYEGSPTGQAFGQAQGAQSLAPQATYADYKVIRRNGSVVSFEPSKIAIAVTKAFLAVNGGQGAASARVRELVEQLTQSRKHFRQRKNSCGAAGGYLRRHSEVFRKGAWQSDRDIHDEDRHQFESGFIAVASR